MLSTDRLTLAYGHTDVVRELSVAIPAGEITCLVGPNGSGKSTLLKGLAGLIAPRQGQVLLERQPLSAWSRNELALRLAMLPQKPIVPEGILVKDLVALGRFPHRKWWQRDTGADREAGQQAMQMTGVDAYSERPVAALSGGQQQRAWIAMALAQQTDILLLDEPTTYLDWGYQLEVLELLVELNRARSLTVVMSLHDLNQAAQFADHVLVLDAGQVKAAGAPGQVITESLLADIFKVRGAVTLNSEGRPYCIGHGTTA
ncbi:ABC transporter ATP-binding protein [Marinobacter fonticola]|uniref:ABC transporter ATP-binding protein n=1 Tax=Marinobacter fonticola TaxID=2603215 RepID=UPI0011E6CF0C|nr:ABC transporter ATP-binding protein [Marinobacter fonticola]